jgi:hypothetical protein
METVYTKQLDSCYAKRHDAGYIAWIPARDNILHNVGTNLWENIAEHIRNKVSAHILKDIYTKSQLEAAYGNLL